MHEAQQSGFDHSPLVTLIIAGMLKKNHATLSNLKFDHSWMSLDLTCYNQTNPYVEPGILRILSSNCKELIIIF